MEPNKIHRNPGNSAHNQLLPLSPRLYSFNTSKMGFVAQLKPRWWPAAAANAHRGQQPESSSANAKRLNAQPDSAVAKTGSDISDIVNASVTQRSHTTSFNVVYSLKFILSQLAAANVALAWRGMDVQAL